MACGDGGQWEKALELLREMPAAGVEPDVVCYNSAITACAKSRRAEEALALLKEMSSTPAVVGMGNMALVREWWVSER